MTQEIDQRGIILCVGIIGAAHENFRQMRRSANVFLVTRNAATTLRHVSKPPLPKRKCAHDAASRNDRATHFGEKPDPVVHWNWKGGPLPATLAVRRVEAKTCSNSSDRRLPPRA
ncbi:hypothetical protein SPHINGOAX6_71066 [Sphingomonas sp. AX6]|nr:hypothetical protein SPHINGOAX6_71066 [Sphingomonas sp. AX6]